MKSPFAVALAAAVLAILLVNTKPKARARDAALLPAETIGGISLKAAAAGSDNPPGSPDFLTEIPPGYRDWKLISVAHEKGNLNDLRAILGNDIAARAYREGKRPFPDGAIIARLAWSYIPSEVNNEAFGREQSFVAGPPTNGIQFMIKDAKKYAATGGWGFVQFNDGKPAKPPLLQRCFPCHEALKSGDLVFTPYSP